jgi:hypothetical protein
VLRPRRIRLRACGIDDHVGAELFGERATCRRIVGGDDRVHPSDLQRRDDGEPDRPAADHQRHLAAFDIGLCDRVHADRERFGQRGMLGRQTVGDFEQQGFAEQHALGIGADIVVGVADALRAFGGQKRRQRADFGAGLEFLRCARTIVEHLAAEFMAEHDVARKIHRLAAGKMFCQFHHAVAVLARVQVGAADAACQRFYQHHARARLGFWQLIDDDFPVAENGCAHEKSFPVIFFHPRAFSVLIASEPKL